MEPKVSNTLICKAAKGIAAWADDRGREWGKIVLIVKIYFASKLSIKGTGPRIFGLKKKLHEFFLFYVRFWGSINFCFGRFEIWQFRNRSGIKIDWESQQFCQPHQLLFTHSSEKGFLSYSWDHMGSCVVYLSMIGQRWLQTTTSLCWLSQCDRIVTWSVHIN